MRGRVLVTGAGGALGAALLRRLGKEGWWVRALIMQGQNFLTDADESVVGDVRNPQSILLALNGVDSVIHMAGVILSRRSGIFYEVNTQGTRNLVDCCRQLGVARFLQISSISVTYPLRNSYADSKWLAEQAVMDSGLHWTILRPTLLVGKGGGAEFQRFAGLVKRSLIPLPAGGSARKRPVHVDDLADGICAALPNQNTYGRIYAMGGASSYSLAEMLRAIAEELGVCKPNILRIPAFLSRGIAHICDLLPGKLSMKQTVQGLLQDADPSIAPAQQDFGYQPQPLLGRFLG